VLDLARLGVVHLEQNPAYRPGGVSDLVIPDPEPAGLHQAGMRPDDQTLMDRNRQGTGD